MARGRNIPNSRCGEKAFHLLSDDTSRVGYLLYYTFADREGRVIADPSVVASMLFPRRRDEITTERMWAYEREWHRRRLIVLYKADGEWYAWFPDFDQTQKGMQKEKEAVSTIPPPPLQSKSGVTPESIQSKGGANPESARSKSGATLPEFKEKRREEKRREGKYKNAGVTPESLQTKSDNHKTGQEAPTSLADFKKRMVETVPETIRDSVKTSLQVPDGQEARQDG